jgi:hypothetical protein
MKEENEAVVWEWIVIYRDGIFPRISLIYADGKGENGNNERNEREIWEFENEIIWEWEDNLKIWKWGNLRMGKCLDARML